MNQSQRFKRFGELSQLQAEQQKHVAKQSTPTPVGNILPGYEQPDDADMDDDNEELLDPSLDFENWVSMSTKGKHEGLLDNQVYVALQNRHAGAPNPNAPLANYLRIRIGKAIIDHLGWQLKDKIKLSYNPNNPYQVALNKSANGYTLHVESQTRTKTIYTIGMKFDNLLRLPQRKGSVIKFGIHELGYLTFRLPRD